MNYTNHIYLGGNVQEEEDGRFTPVISIGYIDQYGSHTSTDDIVSANTFTDEDEAYQYLNETLMYDMFNIHIMELATELDGAV